MLCERLTDRERYQPVNNRVRLLRGSRTLAECFFLGSSILLLIASFARVPESVTRFMTRKLKPVVNERARWLRVFRVRCEMLAAQFWRQIYEE